MSDREALRERVVKLYADKWGVSDYWLADAAIAIVLEEAARCAESASFQFTHTPSTVEVVDVRHTIAAAIRALATASSAKPSQSGE